MAIDLRDSPPEKVHEQKWEHTCKNRPHGKECDYMKNSITLCIDNPIKTDISTWLNNHLGRVSVGRNMGSDFEIIAYSDYQTDFAELHRIARVNNAKYINSVISEGVTAID